MMGMAARESVVRHAWQALPFGSDAAHVNVDFSAAAPYAVTAVLTACLRGQNGQRLDETEAWSWTVASRLQGLLAVVRTTRPADLDISARCDRCHEPLSFSLPLEGFLQTPPSGLLRCQPENDSAFNVRLPTGADQKGWLETGEDNPETLAKTLVVDEQALARWDENHLSAMEQVLEEADPYTALDLESECPYCEAAVSQPLDLESVLLHRLQSALTERLREVHRLARAYHWSESDILALPAQRREFYLACIARESAS